MRQQMHKNRNIVTQRHRYFVPSVKDGFITGDKLQLLWGFANDSDLHEITRCEALEAIGVTHFDYATAWTDRIRNLCARRCR